MARKSLFERGLGASPSPPPSLDVVSPGTDPAEEDTEELLPTDDVAPAPTVDAG